MKLARSLTAWALMLLALAPAGASAASFNFFSTDGLGPTGGAGDFGPANRFPTSLDVEGLSGTLTKATVTIFDFTSGSPDDVDMLLVGPEGDEVMLMSDACGDDPKRFEHTALTFDDDAPSLLPDDGTCVISNQAVSFKPSNFAGASEPDQFGAGGSIGPPYGSALADFAGTDPNGPWDLFVLDDSVGVNGFGIKGWVLTLTVEPPVGPPAPSSTTTNTQSAPATGSAPPATGAKKTGKRAARLAKCKLKKTKEQRIQCRAKARKLPV